MTIAILATGDEIVHGDTLNTNGQQLAHALSSEGLSLGLHAACSDKEGDIIKCLQFLASTHDIVIIIGGLGPTTDDLTRFALAKFTGHDLVQHPEALDHIKERLQHSKVTINEGNLQQCLFPENATLLPNPNGTALGAYYHSQHKLYILLPGPPRECLPMFNNYVLPMLEQTKRSNKHILKWRIFGLAESEIAQILEDSLKDIDCQTGYRLEMPYIEFKVRCTSEMVETVKHIVEPILAPHIIATVNKKASDALRELIVSLNQPITIIDRATGGALESLIVKPDSHHLIDFQNGKNNELRFEINGLDEYWSQIQGMGKANLSIRYNGLKQSGEESHTLPYRSAYVVYHAAEWLSFRLAQLINQLH